MGPAPEAAGSPAPSHLLKQDSGTLEVEMRPCGRAGSPRAQADFPRPPQAPGPWACFLFQSRAPQLVVISTGKVSAREGGGSNRAPWGSASDGKHSVLLSTYAFEIWFGSSQLFVL